MKNIVVCLLSVVFAVDFLGAGELRISPNGHSLRVALEGIREVRKKGDDSHWTVMLTAGEYHLSEPLTLLPGDRNITFQGEVGTRLTGGGVIGPWKDDGDGVWSAPIPRDGNGAPIWFESLFVNGRRAQRARLPSKGFVHFSSYTNFCIRGDGVPDRWIERVSFTNDSVATALSAVPQDEITTVQMCVDRLWCYATRSVRRWEPSTSVLETEFAKPIPSYAPWTTGGATSVAFENLPMGFDEPGEWLYAKNEGRVRYRPLPGEVLSEILAVAPVSKLSQLVVVKGDPDSGHLVSDVVFDGISFSGSDLPRCNTIGSNGMVEFEQFQAAYYCDAAIMLEGASNVTFRACSVRQTGNYAFRIEDGCRHCRIERCQMEDLGAGGVWIGSREPHLADGEVMSRRRITTLAPRSTAFISVTDCTIRNAGNVNPEGVGVVIGHASDCRVEHNDIGDLYYSGVSLGWVWGYRGSVAQRNTVAFNRIHDLGKGRLSDMGGIYTLATSYGTCVSNNIIWNVLSGGYGGWGLYCDEGSEGIVMENNLVYDVDDGGFHQHYGADNLIRNNIIAFVQRKGAVRTERVYGTGGHVGEVMNSLFFYGNIVYSEGVPLVGSNVRKTWGVWAGNVWYDGKRDARPLFDGVDWIAWKASGKEIGGVYADPLFENVAERDFRLKQESPAVSLGFRPWDFGTAGVRE